VEPAQALYQLQELDLKIDADTATLAAERAKMNEPPAVHDARASLRALEEQLTVFQRQLRSTEQEVESLAAKKNAIHAKLYGGAVTVPRELAALENEEQALARTLSQLEDRELELMASAEQAESSMVTATQRLQEELERWRREGSAAHDHIDRLEAEVEKLQLQRAELAAQISPANLRAYERLRPRKGGRAVALVQNNMCQACRVTLPSGDVARARGADPPRTCENCGRILYVR
jgi:predicted  nucleic acid-binding Zn-ribbon protein